MHPTLSLLIAIAFFVMMVLRLYLQAKGRDGNGPDDRGGPKQSGPRSPNGGNVIKLPSIDNREAAGILMMRLARAGSTLTARKREVIAEQAMEYFDLDIASAQSLVDYCEERTDHIDNPQEQIARMIDAIAATVGPKELVDLDTMLVAVSEAEGLPNPAQLKVLQYYRDQAGIEA